MHLTMMEINLLCDIYHIKAVKLEVIPRIEIRNIVHATHSIFAGIRLPTLIWKALV
jgi:hypothetical protein